MKNPIIYILLNHELKMSSGKAASQSVHAAMMLGGAAGGYDFTEHYKRTVVVLEAKNSEQIKNLHDYLRKAYIWSQYYVDEGANEVIPYSITALAVGPIDSEDTEKRALFADFPLFGYKRRDWSRFWHE